MDRRAGVVALRERSLGDSAPCAQSRPLRIEPLDDWRPGWDAHPGDRRQWANARLNCAQAGTSGLRVLSVPKQLKSRSALSSSRTFEWIHSAAIRAS
jgi:hypothetical protein